ncbi:MAG: hypothetical protein ABF683_12335 [Sporolactobacillus sp.]
MRRKQDVLTEWHDKFVHLWLRSPHWLKQLILNSLYYIGLKSFFHALCKLLFG